MRGIRIYDLFLVLGVFTFSWKVFIKRSLRIMIKYMTLAELSFMWKFFLGVLEGDFSPL